MHLERTPDWGRDSAEMPSNVAAGHEEGDHRLVVAVVVDVLPDVHPLEVPTSDMREGRRATERG